MTWRPAGKEERAVAYLWASAAGGSLLLAPLWTVLAPALPPCLWHAWTGLPCPACGTTRAALALLEGEAVSALAFNPLAATAGAVFLLGGLVAPLWALGRGPIPILGAPLPPSLRAFAAAVILVNWLYLVWAGV